MDTQGAVPFPFNTYATSLGGATLGAVYEDHTTGKRFRLCQAHTELAGSVLVVGSPVVMVGATGMTATDDVDTGLDATYPVGLGFATSACPVSISTTTVYYFWAQTRGRVETDPLAGPTGGTLVAIPETGDSIVAGSNIFASSTDKTVGKSLQTATNTATGVEGFRILGFALAASDDTAHTVTVYACMSW